MTEADWRVSNDPLAMYRFLQDSTTLMRTRWQGWVPVRRFRFSARRAALFRQAVAARLLPLVQSPATQRLLELMRDELLGEPAGERYLGGGPRYQAFLMEANRTHPPEVSTGWEALRGLLAADPGQHPDGLFLAGVAGADRFAPHGDLWERGRLVDEERATHAALLREFAGNPFHTPELPEGWETWQNGLLKGMATQIDQDEDFASLPVLADALEDAGCTDAEILIHCRQSEPHQRGCWVLEFLLGRD